MQGMPIDRLSVADGKFATEDVSELRDELLESGLDSWQVAELIASFLTARGYGISSGVARDVVTRIDAPHCSVEIMHQELERLALFM